MIAGRDNVANPIGQALSAMTLGATPGNGEKIAISGLTQQRLDGRQVVKERRAGVKSDFLQPQRGSGDTLRTADNTPRRCSI